MQECYAGPVETNTKCVVISFLLAAGYWFAPPKNKLVLVAILYFTYLAIAWYDYLYDCKRNFGPTYLRHFYEIFKPPQSRQVKLYKRLCPDIARQIFIVDIVVFAIVMVAFYKFGIFRELRNLFK